MIKRLGYLVIKKHMFYSFRVIFIFGVGVTWYSYYKNKKNSTSNAGAMHPHCKFLKKGDPRTRK